MRPVPKKRNEGASAPDGRRLIVPSIKCFKIDGRGVSWLEES
jgi:hypothetical protein